MTHNPKFKAVPVTKPAFKDSRVLEATVVSPAEARRRLRLQEERAEITRTALSVANPDAGIRSVPTDDSDNASFLVPIEQLKEYEHNPRRRTSDALADLKESIRAKGIQQVITVTKRPGDTVYIPYSGGNSRLRCAKELFAERCEGYQRFAMLRVVYRTFTSESDVFAAHIAENEVRADIPFWDKAKAAMELKRLIEQEQGKTLSSRELEAAFAEKGIPGAQSSIVYFTFATNRLNFLGEAGYFVSRTQVKEQLQRRFVAWDSLAKKAGKLDAHHPALNEELSRIGQRALLAGALDSDTLIREAETNAIAPLYGVTPERLRQMLTLQDSFGELTYEQLLAQTEPPPPTDKPAAYDPQIPGVARDRLNAMRKVKPDAATANGQRALLPPQLTSPPATPPTEAAHSLTAPAESPDTLNAVEALLDEIWSCAFLAANPVGLQALITQDDGMPLGFIIDVPANGEGVVPSVPPADEAERLALGQRRYVWWLLSIAAMQHPEQGLAYRLPDCHWRSHCTATANKDPDLDDMSYIEGYRFNALGGEPTVFDLDRALWSVNVAGEPAADWTAHVHRLHALAAQLRSIAPQRFERPGVGHEF